MADKIMDGLLSSMTAARVAITRRDVSVEALTSRFLSIIADSNSVIGAVRSAAADEALEAARAMDVRLEAGGSLAPLAGMPVIVKENCDTAGMACSAGLPFRAGHIPAADAPVVRRLREVGAIILGVSVSDPGAFGVRTAEVTHPCDATLTVGGSSGGSAAALQPAIVSVRWERIREARSASRLHAAALSALSRASAGCQWKEYTHSFPRSTMSVRWQGP